MRALAAMRPSGVATIYTTVQATAAPATATTTVVSYQDRTITAGGVTQYANATTTVTTISTVVSYSAVSGQDFTITTAVPSALNQTATMTASTTVTNTVTLTQSTYLTTTLNQTLHVQTLPGTTLTATATTNIYTTAYTTIYQTNVLTRTGQPEHLLFLKIAAGTSQEL
ncbi:hypothetical protein LTR22_019450 [Elasticomyces elasticus]|nr:hypothetical protein LTR22_019450 [Elasticomyces elasticus]